ncbi:MAG: Uma2 family endonuclease [Chloroflexota bacterium]
MSVLVREESLFQTLLKSPKLSLYQSEIEKVLLTEQQKRADFYKWITEDTRAEFINGEVVMQSPAKHRHTTASVKLVTLLNAYVMRHNLGVVCAETALITLTRNDYLPDICFFGNAKAADISGEQMTYPAPDFIIEILSPSTEKTDRGIKFQDYAAHEVQEYWLVDPDQNFVEQYTLNRGTYQHTATVNLGDAIRSYVIEGFEIDVDAIFTDSANLLALQSIISG